MVIEAKTEAEVEAVAQAGAGAGIVVVLEAEVAAGAGVAAGTGTGIMQVVRPGVVVLFMSVDVSCRGGMIGVGLECHLKSVEILQQATAGEEVNADSFMRTERMEIA